MKIHLYACTFKKLLPHKKDIKLGGGGLRWEGGSRSQEEERYGQNELFACMDLSENEFKML